MKRQRESTSTTTMTTRETYRAVSFSDHPLFSIFSDWNITELRFVGGSGLAVACAFAKHFICAREKLRYVTSFEVGRGVDHVEGVQRLLQWNFPALTHFKCERSWLFDVYDEWLELLPMEQLVSLSLRAPYLGRPGVLRHCLARASNLRVLDIKGASCGYSQLETQLLLFVKTLAESCPKLLLLDVTSDDPSPVHGHRRTPYTPFTKHRPEYKQLPAGCVVKATGCLVEHHPARFKAMRRVLVAGDKPDEALQLMLSGKSVQLLPTPFLDDVEALLEEYDEDTGELLLDV